MTDICWAVLDLCRSQLWHCYHTCLCEFLMHDKKFLAERKQERWERLKGPVGMRPKNTTNNLIYPNSLHQTIRCSVTDSYKWSNVAHFESKGIKLSVATQCTHNANNNRTMSGKVIIKRGWQEVSHKHVLVVSGLIYERERKGLPSIKGFGAITTLTPVRFWCFLHSLCKTTYISHA